MYYFATNLFVEVRVNQIDKVTASTAWSPKLHYLNIDDSIIVITEDEGWLESQYLSRNWSFPSAKLKEEGKGVICSPFTYQ